jgi:glyoxylase-like metal-dependent hydrolase (beta-lactamase superfamily II)
MPFLNSSFPSFGPDVLLDKEMSLRDYGVDGRIVFTPGHTDGSISVMLDTGEMICGDLLRGGYLGGAICPTRPGYPYVAHDLQQVRASIRRLLDLKPSKIYVGHGGPFDPASVAKWLSRTEA